MQIFMPLFYKNWGLGLGQDYRGLGINCGAIDGKNLSKNLPKIHRNPRASLNPERLN